MKSCNVEEVSVGCSLQRWRKESGGWEIHWCTDYLGLVSETEQLLYPTLYSTRQCTTSRDHMYVGCSIWPIINPRRTCAAGLQ